MHERPHDTLVAQVEAWNRGDLEGYLEWMDQEVLYQHGEVVLRGVDALRAHYAGQVVGRLSIEVVYAVEGPNVAVLAVRAQLAGERTWEGRALLTLVARDGRWWVVADATA